MQSLLYIQELEAEVIHKLCRQYYQGQTKNVNTLKYSHKDEDEVVSNKRRRTIGNRSAVISDDEIAMDDNKGT